MAVLDCRGAVGKLEGKEDEGLFEEGMKEEGLREEWMRDVGKSDGVFVGEGTKDVGKSVEGVFVVAWRVVENVVGQYKGDGRMVDSKASVPLEFHTGGKLLLEIKLES